MRVPHSGWCKACHDGGLTETMSKKKLEFTRRRVLGGIGTIGVASAAAGLGTSAYLNDTESFENNMMTAGELDLAVDYVVHENQGSAGTYTINSFTNTVNEEGVDADLTLNGDGSAMSQDLDDVKPGDWGYSRFCFEIDDNPAYVWACGALTDSSENDYTEPEPEDDNGEGELEESIEVEVLYCDLDDEGELVSEGETIMSGTLKEVLAQLQTGIPLDGTGDGDAMAGDQSPYAGTGMDDDLSDDVTNPCLCFDWEVPTTVGNEIQGDSLMFDLQFYALQARHNDGTTNPCAITTETGDDFVKIAREFNEDNTISAGARARYGNNGSSGAWELAVGDEPGVPGEFEQDDYVWTSGQTVDYSVDYDASSDEMTFSFDGNDITSTIDDPQPDGRMAIQGKADEATVEASIDDLTIDGSSVTLDGPTSVTATNDDDGADRQIRHLVVNTALDGETSFQLSGEATVTLQGDYDSSAEEGAVFDVVFE